MKKGLSLIVSVLLLLTVDGSAWAATPVTQEVIVPSGLCLKADGTVLMTDLAHKAIWSEKDGVRTCLTGKAKIIGVDGVPVGGYRDGVFGQALFQSPWAIAPYRGGYAITDPDNHRVRFMDTEKVSTLAGEASFKRPTGLVADGEGNLYIADTGDNCIRKMDAKGNVTRYAGSTVAGNSQGSAGSVCFREPTGLAFADGILYVADSGNHRICKIERDWVTTVAGTTQVEPSDSFYHGGYANGPAATAQFSNPQGVAVEGATIYVADTGNSAIRKIEKGVVSTVTRRTQEVSNYLVSPRSIIISGNNLLIGDVFTGAVLTLAKNAQVIDNPPAVPAVQAPTGGLPSMPVSPSLTQQPTAPQAAETTYTIKKGDTLGKIAATYHCTVAELVALNGIKNPGLIRVGQVLQIPTL